MQISKDIKQQWLWTCSTCGSGKLPVTWQAKRRMCPSWRSTPLTPSYFWALLVEFGSDNTHSTFCTGTVSHAIKQATNVIPDCAKISEESAKRLQKNFRKFSHSLFGKLKFHKSFVYVEGSFTCYHPQLRKCGCSNTFACVCLCS